MLYERGKGLLSRRAMVFSAFHNYLIDWVGDGMNVLGRTGKNAAPAQRQELSRFSPLDTGTPGQAHGLACSSRPKKITQSTHHPLTFSALSLRLTGITGIILLSKHLIGTPIARELIAYLAIYEQSTCFQNLNSIPPLLICLQDQKSRRVPSNQPPLHPNCSTLPGLHGIEALARQRNPICSSVRRTPPPYLLPASSRVVVRDRLLFFPSGRCWTRGRARML